MISNDEIFSCEFSFLLFLLIIFIFQFLKIFKFFVKLSKKIIFLIFFSIKKVTDVRKLREFSSSRRTKTTLKIFLWKNAYERHYSQWYPK